MQAIREAGGRRPGEKGLGRLPYGCRVLAALAEERGLGEAAAGRVRRLADPGRGLTRTELDELCRLVRRLPAGEALGVPAGDRAERLPVFRPSHLGVLMTMPRGGDRDSLLERAVRQCWPLARLER